MDMGSFSWHVCAITACRCCRGACPTLFLTAHSPRAVGHKSAPAQQFLPRLMRAPNWMEARRPLLHVAHTRFSSAKPHPKPGYAHDTPALAASLRSPVDEQS